MMWMHDSQGQDALRLLGTLHRPDAKQYLEWSIHLSAKGVVERLKPTLYCYPEGDPEVFLRLQGLLELLHCPEEVVRKQAAAMPQSMYQGIRIPQCSDDGCCLYLHESGNPYIDAYKWKDSSSNQHLTYRYVEGTFGSEWHSKLHPKLTGLFDELIGGREIGKQYGMWVQRFGDQSNELYLSFPSRPNFDWVVEAFQSKLSEAVYDQLRPYRDLKFKNIGFLCAESHQEPSVTIYFTLPVRDAFPRSRDELIARTRSHYTGELLAATS